MRPAQRGDLASLDWRADFRVNSQACREGGTSRQGAPGGDACGKACLGSVVVFLSSLPPFSYPLLSSLLFSPRWS